MALETVEPFARTRLAELLAALSVVTDLARGHPPEEAMSACLLATRLAQAAGLPGPEVADAYYATLLRFIGCTATSPEYAQIYGGDDVAVRREGDLIDAASPSEALGFLWGLARPAGMARALAFLSMVRGSRGRSEMMAADCQVAVRLATRFGFGSGVQAALSQGFERWDGQGGPAGLAGSAIALPARLGAVAFAAVMFNATGGVRMAMDALRRWRGRILDPALTDAFLGDAAELLELAHPPDVWEAVVLAEPDPPRMVSASELDAVAEGFADFADLKSAYLYGHSTGVARLAVGAANQMGLDAQSTAMLRRAALLHDIGRVGVPTGVWDTPGPLSRAAWEQVRLHPYHTERILGRAPALASAARIASAHHERLDGSGYHRAVGGAYLARESRLLAAADVFHALTEARPHRPALSQADAALGLEAMVAEERLDAAACRAVVLAAGERPARRSTNPAGLSDREVEVLRLLAAGRTERDIAGQLVVSPATVHTHVTHIYQKTRVSTRAALALYAMENQLLGPAA